MTEFPLVKKLLTHLHSSWKKLFKHVGISPSSEQLKTSSIWSDEGLTLETPAFYSTYGEDYKNISILSTCTSTSPPKSTCRHLENCIRRLGFNQFRHANYFFVFSVKVVPNQVFSLNNQSITLEQHKYYTKEKHFFLNTFCPCRRGILSHIGRVVAGPW